MSSIHALMGEMYKITQFCMMVITEKLDCVYPLIICNIIYTYFRCGDYSTFFRVGALFLKPPNGGGI